MTKTVDNDEVVRFGTLASQWWAPDGPFRPLHQINPARLLYIRTQIGRHFGRDDRSVRPLAKLRVLDVGCGGGLITEPLARLGAEVTGLEPAAESIQVARDHAEGQRLSITYRQGTIDAMAGEGSTFDVVLALEVVEHVPDPGSFLQSCAMTVRPGGLLITSTLNRTAKSFALGIVAAEYLLGWLPRGTHQWNRFMTQEELREKILDAGLAPEDETGLSFDPIKGEWQLDNDLSVNFFLTAAKAG